MRSFNAADESVLHTLAASLATPLVDHLQMRPQGDAALMTLHGELGAGKSAFTRALLRSLGHTGAVPSPTYTLIESYSTGGLAIAHADFYRLASPDELDFLGIEEVLEAHDLLCVEWPERAGDRLPVADLELRLEYADGGGRHLFFSGALAELILPTSL